MRKRHGRRGESIHLSGPSRRKAIISPVVFILVRGGTLTPAMIVTVRGIPATGTPRWGPWGAVPAPSVSGEPPSPWEREGIFRVQPLGAHESDRGNNLPVGRRPHTIASSSVTGIIDKDQWASAIVETGWRRRGQGCCDT